MRRAEFSFSCLRIDFISYFSILSLLHVVGVTEKSHLNSPVFSLRHDELHPSPDCVLPSSHSDLKTRPSPQMSWQIPFTSNWSPFLHWHEVPTRIRFLLMSQRAHVAVLSGRSWPVTHPDGKGPHKSYKMTKGGGHKQYC